MPDKKDNPKSTSFDRQMDAANTFAGDGQHQRALEIYETLFAGKTRDQTLYEGAARSALSAILDSGFSTDWPQTRRDAVYRRLILQTDRFGAPPAFAFQIASAHSNMAGDTLARVAAALTPTLSALWDEGNRERPFLVMVLLLRPALPGWRDPAEISRWHLDLFDDFDRSDMAIPYNAMFDGTSFAANIADLTGLIARTPPADLARRFPRWKLMLLYWITGNALDDKLAPILAQLRAQGPDASGDEDDSAAFNSLSLRWASTHDIPARALALDTVLGDLADRWHALRGSSADQARAASAKARLPSKQRQAVHAGLDLVQRRAPFLKLGRRPRIAVCISGQLRGYRQAYPSWRAGLLRGIEHEVVVHSWEKIGRSGAEPVRAYLPFAGPAFCAAYRAEAHRAGMAVMQARYPALFAGLQQGGVVTTDALSAFYGTDHVVLEDDAGPQFAGWSNSRKMHYKLAAAAGLLERLSGDFDLVLRVRPDKQLGLVAFGWNDLLAATRRSATLFADVAMGHQYNHLLIGDQVAIGAPATMAAYAQTLDLVPVMAAQHLFNCTPAYIGHVSLAHSCWHAGIDVQRLPVRMGGLMEAEPMSAPDIAAALETDAAGRMDHMDQILLAAIRADLGTSAS
jgi:hypothetical protein